MIVLALTQSILLPPDDIVYGFNEMAQGGRVASNGMKSPIKSVKEHNYWSIHTI